MIDLVRIVGGVDLLVVNDVKIVPHTPVVVVVVLSKQ
jgi:hypothetical protein